MTKKLPTLSDTDIVTNEDSKPKTQNLMKMSTLAMTLAMTMTSASMLSSCSDESDCDSDVTSYADPAADSFDSGAYDATDSFDYGQYDTTDSDVGNTRDSKPCD